MRLFGYTISKAPHYTLAEIHQYQEDLAKEEIKLEFMKQSHPDYDVVNNIVHVMREVLVRMLEKI